MSDLQDFKDDLERQLVAASRRLDLEAASETSRYARVKPVLVAAVILVVVAAGVLGIPQLLDTKPTAADSLVITQLDEQVEIRVIDIVSDPGAVVDELERELGLPAVMLAVPAPPSLVGRVKSIDAPGSVDTQIEVDSDGMIALIILPRGFSGTLTIEYGREADAGEGYAVTTTDPQCSEFYGLSPAKSLPELRGSLGDSLRFETRSVDGVVEVDADPQAIPSDYQLGDIQSLSASSYLIIYVEDQNTYPLHPSCQ